MIVENLNEILEKSNSLSDLSRYIFGKENYTNREKSKKILEENNVNWQEWLSSKKNKPIYCLCCGKEILGKDKKRKKFCSHVCAGIYNNGNNKKEKFCIFCGKPITSKKYCSKECQNKHKEQIQIDNWKNGIESGCDIAGGIKLFLRRYLLNKYNYKCQKCGFDKVNTYTGNSILQIHHIDGNCFNSKEENLMVLCPNCHALTENFGSRNINSTRIDRRTKYFREGNLEKKIKTKDKEIKEKKEIKTYDFNLMVSLIKELKSFTSVGREMGVSDTAIKKRFIKRGYPSDIKNLLKALDD